jgi:Protein of unknwon function (DUF3310)
LSANNKQIAGSHYKSKMECWDYILANDLGYLEGTAIKYITRWKKKNGVEDILKAIHFLEKLVEVEKAKQQAVDLDGVMQVWQGKPLEWETDAMDNRNES